MEWQPCAIPILDKLNETLKFKLAFILGNIGADSDKCLELACLKFGSQYLTNQLDDKLILFAVWQFVNEAVKGKIYRTASGDNSGKYYVGDLLSQVCDVDKTITYIILDLVKSYINRLQKTGSRLNPRLYTEAELVSKDIWKEINIKDVLLVVSAKKTIYANLVVSLLQTFRHSYGTTEVDSNLVTQIVPNPTIDSLTEFVTSPIFDLIMLA